MATKPLTAEQKHRISEYIKCKKDPIYFMEHYIKLSLAGGDVAVKLYDRQIDFIKDFLEKHYLIVCKSRQTGVSTITQMLCAHMCVFYKNVVIGAVSKAGAESSDFARKTISMIDTLPEWMRPTFIVRNSQSFILDNGCQFYANQVNDSNPEGLFRGKALTFLVIDEGAFIPKIDDAYTGVAPTLFKSHSAAKANNVPYGTIIISTPNKTIGKGKWYYQTWTNSINGDSIFQPFKLHWTMIDEFKNDPLWYKTQCELLGNIHWKIAQELDMQFIASSNSFLPTEIIEQLNKCYIDPKQKMKLFNYEMWQFSDVDQSRFVLIGIDTASQSGSDNSTVEVFDFETFVQVAEFKGKLRVDDFCKIISLVTKIYPNNIIIPESNSYGNQVCEYLTKSGSFYNIYQSKVGDQKNKTTDNSAKQKYKYGLSTTPYNRPLMIDALYTLIKEDPTIVKSERLALELIGLVDNGRGKIMAEEGEQDDLSLAMSFCAYVRTYDPPLGVSKDIKSQSVMDDMLDVAKWNNQQINMVAPELTELKNMSDDNQNEDRITNTDKMNRVLGKYIKQNLINPQGGSNGVIDIMKLLERTN